MAKEGSDNPFAILLGNTQQLPAAVPPPSDDQPADELNDTVERLFLMTLNKSDHGKRECVYMEDIASTFTPQTLFTIEILEQALFERLMLSNPAEALVRTSGKAEPHAVQTKCMVYLLESYRRSFSERLEQLPRIRELIVRNVVTGLQQPEVYFEQDVYRDLINALVKEAGDEGLVHSFLVDVSKEIETQENGNELEATRQIFVPLLNIIAAETRKFKLQLMNMSYVAVIHAISRVAPLASVLIQHSMPASDKGKAYCDTVLGSFLTCSCIPSTDLGPYEFFQNLNIHQPSSEEGIIWSSMNIIYDATYTLFNNLLRCSPAAREQTLIWLGRCIHANYGKGKIWTTQFSGLLDMELASDGFILNLSALCVKLCLPFCSEPFNPKLLRVDPTYCAASLQDVSANEARGVHLPKLFDVTCLVPYDETRPTSPKYSFITEAFFFAHRTFDLGFRILHEKLAKYSQELNRVQRLYNEVQAQSTGSEAIESIKDRMQTGMTRYFTLKSALLHPKSLEANVRFALASASWLAQVAVGDLKTFKTISFPLSEDVPPSLASVPEFVVENIIELVVFLRRFEPSSFEEHGPLLEHILTFILVFMGSPDRMRNPHLRAKLAECLESLMPHSEEAQQNTLLGSFHRQRLFVEHPHAAEIVPTLLHVFVSIEMTGQSVAFEQKFNYRRPMYIVMDYLWELAQHKQRFKELAAGAEKNIDAVQAPLFLRFINLLMNDAIFLLDEALSYMSQLKDQQAARDRGEWGSLPNHERQQNENMLVHMEMIARFHNVLGKETIHVLEMLTSEIRSIFTHPTLVDRVAGMLNYFLLHLVGPKKQNFRVKDKDKYEFKPEKIVTDICQMYIHLETSESFCRAVAQDGRSYSTQLFQQAEVVLMKIGRACMIPSLQLVAEKVLSMSEQQKTEEELLSDVPDEFLDPIMSTIMRDPVVLPSSKIVVDRATIARHLLSDQSDPFNRMPLTMDQVVSETDLRSRIQAWLEEQKGKQKSKDDNLTADIH